jgi:hypothetical protein
LGHSSSLSPSRRLTFVPREGRRVFLAAPKDRTIYFTTDGTDPRLVGGQAAPTARPYAGPVDLPESQTLKARAFDSADDGAEWSAAVEASPINPPNSELS